MRILPSQKLIKYLLVFLLFFCFIQANAQNQGLPPTVVRVIEGVPVIKTDLMNEVVKYDSTMTFKKNPDEKGWPNVIGADQLRGTLQLVGDEYNIRLAKWTYTFGDDQVNMTGLTNMGHFAFLVGKQPCVNWLIEKIKAVANDHNHAFTEDKLLFDNIIKGNVNYDPTSLTLSLSFTPIKRAQ
jgi:hypothetical protein